MFCVILCLMLQPLGAQSHLIDSLQNRVGALSDNTEKVNTLLYLADHAAESRPEMAMEAVISAGQMAETIKFNTGVIKAGLKQADLLVKQYRFSEAHKVLDRTIELTERLDEKLLLSDALFAKGNCYYQEGKFEASIQFTKRAITLSEQLQRKPGFLAGRYCTLGTTLRNTGEFEEALEYCQRGLAIYQQNNVSAGVCYALTQISLIYAKMGDFSKALETEQRSLTVARESKDEYRQVVSLHNICDILIRLGDLDKALQLTPEIERLNPVLKDLNADIELYKLRGRIFHATNDAEQALVNYQKALIVANKTNNAAYIAGVWQDMTPTLIALGQTDKAERGLLKVIKALEVNKDTITLESLNIQLGEVKIAQQDYETAKSIFNKVAEWYGFNSMYLESGQVYEKLAEIYLKTKQTEQALAAAQKNLAFCEKTHSKTAIADAHHLLYRVYKELGDFPSALYQHEAYFLLLDSVKTIDLRRRLSEERVKQNVEDLEAEKKRVERESALLLVRNRLYLTLGSLLLLILIIGSYLYTQLRKTRKELAIQNSKLTQLNQEKDKFFSIIAHDLRSPLVAFQGVGAQLKYCLDKGNLPMLNKISELLTKSAANLSGLLDNLLSWALLNRGMMPYHPEPIPLHNMVADMFQIYENTAAVKGIYLVNKVPSEIAVQADSNALQAILRNLIGNAIKFTPAGQDGQVSVSGHMEAGKVSITVQDTGTGMPPEKLGRVFTLEKRSERGTAGEKGAGLGLLLCKELVELHQGILTAHSTEGKGTSFVFSLPIA